MLSEFTCAMQRCPTVRVLCVHITSKLYQKSAMGKKRFVKLCHIRGSHSINSLDNLEMSRADGIMKCGDAFVVRRTGIRHLHGSLLHQFEFTL